jgi:hypothetical protein
MTGSVLKNLSLFSNLCGQKAMPNVVLATTMWSKVENNEGLEREAELKSDFWGKMMEDGCKIARFVGTYESAWEIIDCHAQRRNAEVLLPFEALDGELRHNNTPASVALNKELEKPIRDRENVARVLEHQAKKQDNGVVVNQLNEWKTQLDDSIDQCAKQFERRKIPFTRRVRLFFSRKRR